MGKKPIPQSSGDVQDVALREALEERYLAYALSTIMHRALPDARDGLKPVHRRILYDMHVQGYRPDRPYVKCAKVTGDTMARFHPHNSVAIYDALARMAQPFSLRHPLIDFHGNYGSPDFPPAAERYTESRLAPLAMHMIEGLDEDTDEDGDPDEDDPDEDDGDEDEDDADDDSPRLSDLELEGDIAADYIEGLLDIADLDGDIDMDVEGDRAIVSVVGATLDELVGDDGEVLEALQELTRLAVHRQTGERARLMLDIGGYRARRRAELAEYGRTVAEEVARTGEPKALAAMSPFERKIVHDAVAAAGLRSESEGEEPSRRVVVFPAQ